MSGPISPRAASLPVTRRQIEVLAIIARAVDGQGFPPTIREIILELGLSPNSRQAVSDHIANLDAKGLILMRERRARAITITAAGRELLARELAQQSGDTSQ